MKFHENFMKFKKKMIKMSCKMMKMIKMSSFRFKLPHVRHT